MEKATTIEALASQVYAQFEQRKRDNGKEYWCRKDNAEDWIQDLCHDAHGDFMPDDWRYSFIVEALSDFANDEDAEPEADVYTSELCDWLASSVERTGYVDEAAEEFGIEASTGIVSLLQYGQYAEKSEVYASVKQSLVDRLAEIEDEELRESEREDEGRVEE